MKAPTETKNKVFQEQIQLFVAVLLNFRKYSLNNEYYRKKGPKTYERKRNIINRSRERSSQQNHPTLLSPQQTEYILDF